MHALHAKIDVKDLLVYDGSVFGSKDQVLQHLKSVLVASKRVLRSRVVRKPAANTSKTLEPRHVRRVIAFCATKCPKVRRFDSSRRIVAIRGTNAQRTCSRSALSYSIFCEILSLQKTPSPRIAVGSKYQYQNGRLCACTVAGPSAYQALRSVVYMDCYSDLTTCTYS
jgi:hypothetical protein